MTIQLLDREKLSENSIAIKKFEYLFTKASKALEGDNFKLYTILLYDTLKTELEYGYQHKTDGLMFYSDIMDKTGLEPDRIYQAIQYLSDNNYIWLRGDYSFTGNLGCIMYIIAFEDAHQEPFTNLTHAYIVNTDIIISQLTGNIQINPDTLDKPPDHRPATRPAGGLEHWNDLRAIMEKRGYFCQLCRAKENLVLHHKHYYTWGHERIEDVLWLCSSCHSKVHNGGDVDE